MNENFTVDSMATINTPEDAELKSLAPQMTLCGGKYRLEKEAGRGGMGVVWKAWDTISERFVALKFVPQEIRHFDKAMEQVRLAFRTIQDLNHQNIRPVYGLEKDPGMGYFVVMKWLEGQSLDAVQLTREQKMTVLEKVAAALDYAHEHGVVHRDVKPSNIFLQMDGDQISEVFLVDFGISAEVQNSMSQHTGAVVHTSGTRAFMPPEQWRGQSQDGRTDQYSLAAVAYWLFAGRLPFHVADTQMLRDCVLLDMPDPIPGENPKLNAAIMRGLAKQRGDRFESCQKLIEAVRGKQVVQTVDQPENESNPSKRNDNQSNKYPLPFIFYWKYWAILFISYLVCYVILRLSCNQILVLSTARYWNEYPYPIYVHTIDCSTALLLLVCIFLLNSALHISQIIWNVVKNKKFQILYGAPISILGVILGSQGLLHFYVLYAMKDSPFNYFGYSIPGLIIGNIISLIIFSFMEKWLKPEVWNSSKCLLRFWFLIIGWIIYGVWFINQCSIVGLVKLN